jgi:hypothetical protein
VCLMMFHESVSDLKNVIFSIDSWVDEQMAYCHICNSTTVFICAQHINTTCDHFTPSWSHLEIKETEEMSLKAATCFKM